MKKGGTGRKMSKSRHTPCVPARTKIMLEREVNRLFKKDGLKRLKPIQIKDNPNWSLTQ